VSREVIPFLFLMLVYIVPVGQLSQPHPGCPRRCGCAKGCGTSADTSFRPIIGHFVVARQLGPNVAKLPGGATRRIANRHVQWRAPFPVQLEDPIRVHAIVEQRSECLKVFLTHTPPPCRLAQHARDHPRVNANQRELPQLQTTSDSPRPPCRPSHPSRHTVAHPRIA
jgi:hypothetical protein